MSSAYVQAGGAHQRERTQLFANVSPYNPASVMRTASPRTRTQSPAASYSDAVLDQMESQNDEQINGLTSKVRMLKDISLRIGDEVRESTTLLTTMEQGFENARVKVKSTMNRMVATSQRHGIGLKHWFGFFGFVWFCFFLVWLI